MLHRNINQLIRSLAAIYLALVLVPIALVRCEEPKPNVLLICIDDLRPELKCFGADYVHSPNIDAIAAKGRPFQRHYVQAPTCGASRYALLTGTYGPASNNALFTRSTAIKHPSFPAWFRKNGYTTVSVGKVSHHPGGRGGDDWDDDSKPEMPDSWDRHLLPAGPWQHPRGAMHGLANGQIRLDDSKLMDVFQSFDGPDTAYPDGLIVDESLQQLEQLGVAAKQTGDEQKPFFLAVGIIRPHLPFGAPARFMEPYANVALPIIDHPEKPVGKTTWHGSKECMKYNCWKRNPNTDAEFATDVRKHYAACVTYADELVGRIMVKLDELNLSDNTIVIVWGDHGWHLGEHAIWGKHALFEESLHSPLIISYPKMAQPGEPTQSLVESIDVFPTVCELAGLPSPDFADGTSLVPILKDPTAAGRASAISYFKTAETIRAESHRLILHKDGFVELYDHRTAEGETRNVAEGQPDKVAELTGQLRARLKK